MIMKYKKFISLFIALFMVSMPASLDQIFALSIVSVPESMIGGTSTEDVSEVMLKHGIKKRESVKSIIKKYPLETSNEIYKYFTIRTEIE